MKDVKPVSVQELRQKLRDSGLRATLPRIAVMQQLLAARAPLSHGEVAEKLAHEGFDRATVYRNLIDLSDVGLLRRSDIGDHVWRFELVTSEEHGQAEHPHFICSGCGAVECLPEGTVS